MTVETLRWFEGCLELLDQTKLPTEVAYVRCSTSDEVVSAIKSMVVRGAPAIGVAGAYAVALAGIQALNDVRGVNFFNFLDSACDQIAASRPTAVNLTWAVERMRSAWSGSGLREPSEVVNLLVSEAKRLHQSDLESNKKLSRYGAKLVPKGARILTHCNAGALATTGHGTALGVIRTAFEKDKTLHVIADETRPLLQGARLTAWELTVDGIPTTLITDNMAGHLMAKSEIDIVIVGADRVAANGDVANKIGTYMVAVLAARHNIPFYVACPWSSIDLKTVTGDAVSIEERGASEVLGYSSIRWVPDNVHVRNPAFDVTPAELITAIITDRGVINVPSAASIRDFDQGMHI